MTLITTKYCPRCGFYKNTRSFAAQPGEDEHGLCGECRRELDYSCFTETGYINFLKNIGEIDPPKEDEMALLTTAQAAELLGVSASRVKQYVQAGELVPATGAGIGSGRVYYFTMEAVEACKQIERKRGQHKSRPRKERGNEY